MSNIEIVDSLRSLYPLQDSEEKAVMEVLAELRELKEKATAKKVRGISLTHEGRVGNCPSCGSFVRNQEHTLYCDCGQHLDWSEGKE